MRAGDGVHIRNPGSADEYKGGVDPDEVYNSRIRMREVTNSLCAGKLFSVVNVAVTVKRMSDGRVQFGRFIAMIGEIWIRRVVSFQLHRLSLRHSVTDGP
jgi:hypothetical protein